MKKIIFFLWTAMIFCSCFNTRLDDTEEKHQQRIKDSIHTDSIEQRRNIPDTTLAIYKRTAFCDTVFVVVFDRVKMLSGEKAEEYAQRHNRFGNRNKIIVNQEVLLETLKIAKGAPILLIDDEKQTDSTETSTASKREDSIKYKNYPPSFLADGMPKEDLVQLIIQHRSIIYFKQLPKEE